MPLQQQVYEFDSYITPDGHQYNLHSPDVRFVLSSEGSGMPPIDYITERGPFQHGDTLKGYRLRPRVIQMIVRQNYGDRDKLIHGRLQLLDALRPNRQTVGTLNTGVLRKQFGDGTLLDLDVLVQSGPNFEPAKQDTWDEWSFQEVIRFIAFNPIYYNPRLKTHEFIVANDPNITQLVFPITFDTVIGGIYFNRAGLPGSSSFLTFTYNGTWLEYPSIIVVGPVGSPIIFTNETTHESLQLNYEVAPGETVTFTLTYGLKSVISNVFGNVAGFLDPASDLGSFHLEPGSNTFSLVAVGTNSSSRLYITYKDRYIGW